MTSKRSIGHVQFCVEVKLPEAQPSLAAHQELLSTCQQLEIMFSGQQVRPTWAVDSRLMTAVTNTLGSASELALLASSPRELDDHIHEAKCSLNRLRFASIATRFEPSLLQVAEVAALGTRAMALPLTLEPRSTRIQTRHGLSMAYTTGALPGYGRFLGCWDAAFQAKGLLHRAMLRNSTELITIQLDRLLRPEQAFRSLQKTLAVTQRLQAAGRLTCETLQEMHSRLCPASRSAQTQRSVLRAA